MALTGTEGMGALSQDLKQHGWDAKKLADACMEADKAEAGQSKTSFDLAEAQAAVSSLFRKVVR